MVRFAARPCAAVVVLFWLLGAPPTVAAQEQALPLLRDAAEAGPRHIVASLPPAAVASVQDSERRPAVLLPLYASFATLQALDVHSTSYALSRGAVEANPLMKGVAANEVGLMAIKAAGTAGVIFVSERVWKKNRAAAVIMMVATNTAMAWVVQHNYRTVR